MRRSTSIAAIAAVLWSLAAAGALLASDAALTPAQERGQQLYRTGKSAGGSGIPPVMQQLGTPAPIVPCLNCHGADGSGGPGDPAAPSVQWQHLSGKSEHRHGSRRHPPFDEATFARALRDGRDPAGNALDVAMPRYAMSQADLADLVAYLEVIANQRDPGLSRSTITIGTVLPATGPLAGAGRAMRGVIETYFSGVNARGGIHGRRLRLAVGSYVADQGPPVWAARDLLASDSVFALVSGYLPGDEPALHTLVNSQRVPLVGPNTVLPQADDSNRYAFYLLAGLAEQAEALVKSFATRHAVPDARLAIVYPRARFINEVAERARLRATALGLPAPRMEVYELGDFDADAIAGRLHEAQARAVMFAGASAELARLATAAAALGWQPELLAPGSLVEAGLRELPREFDGRAWLAFATIPADRSPEALRQLERMRGAAGLDTGHEPARVSAFNAAVVLVAALERAGKSPSREKLVAALEQMNGFRPGLAPPLSFGPSRRIGALGAYVFAFDLERRQISTNLGGWVALGESP